MNCLQSLRFFLKQCRVSNSGINLAKKPVITCGNPKGLVNRAAANTGKLNAGCAAFEMIRYKSGDVFSEFGRHY